ncbi:30S ribosomal protein S12 methylthiotransferase RimO [Gracilinema caldarium]|uniref:Ribosomal protein uS12 methylthiotransferase RimO n=1 Tax=Gracilinema caldarium (strain ATCC 51460 / DSM 7334 / H1) TaxID=744872 RepID=F8EYP9_GRAC1|nr:30S ribosomal protein S12 methylthiotransferase RimO [Gracilinema caldarium]AEJ18626.1 Ribosomal protein S12 methylthiotransferase rimO [Gracilinema caldarium DSM 7334]
MNKRFYLDPHGCAKNQVDGEILMSVLAQSGWEACAEAEDADLVIVNSCGFIESAKRESIEAVLSYKQLYPQKRVLLAGCLAQRYADELAAELQEADALFGNTDLSRIAEAAEQAMSSSHKALVPPLDNTGKTDFARCSDDRPLLSLPGSAYVKITEGCDNRCTYCAIPLIRGNLRSRSIDSVVAECSGLLKRGVKELCLIGQDLGSYGKDGAAGAFAAGQCRLAELLSAISALPGDFWVRLLYIHPDHFPFEILPICKRDSRILPYFDLPFQHASERILRLMNRRGNAEAYLNLLTTIQKELPDATIRSTFLVGFPGETDEDMQILLDFQQRAQLDWLGVFTYSREEDTPAYSMKGRVPKKVAEGRKRQIEAAQIPITESRMDRFVGRTLPVLIEERVENEDGLYLGRTLCQAPEVDGSTVLSADQNLTPGTFVSARVFSRAGFDLDAAFRTMG